MAIGDRQNQKLFKLFPFWQRRTTTTSSSSSALTQNQSQNYRSSRHGNRNTVSSAFSKPSSPLTVSSFARSLLPTPRRLRLDPSSYLYFPYEPGKQVRSAIKIKNKSKSHTAFKFQTTAPKSCYMRPPGGVLAPGESVFATVYKFVEHPENNEKQQLNQKSKVKFKIMSLKVKPGVEYVPELFEEQKNQVAVEQVLRVIFLDVDRPSALKLKLQLNQERSLHQRQGLVWLGRVLSLTNGRIEERSILLDNKSKL